MAIAAAAAVTATATDTAAEASKSAMSKSKMAENFDTFLVMLTTQLKHQDPLSPMDSTEFTNQLVQFANVEQQINANANLENLIKIQKTNQSAMAISYLGQTGEIAGTDLPLQDGKASFSYTLPEDARTFVAIVRDTSGKIVRTLTGDSSTGRHEAAWDGKDANGNQLKDGKYTLEYSAVNAAGESLAVDTTVYGRFTDVSSDSNGTLLNMSGVVSSLDKILTIRETASLAK